MWGGGGVEKKVLCGLREKQKTLTFSLFTLPQIYAQVNYFLKDPIKNDVAYQARAQPFLVFGLLCTGLAIGHHNAGL